MAGRRENPRVWTALGLVLVLYVFCALRLGPISHFGGGDDDAQYYSSAKALANGQGYILPSFPVTLRATKYPELYPLLLAEIWKVDPHFPGNILPAVGLTLAFGCLALVFAFLLLRQWPGLDDWQALGIVSLCALTGYFLELSASVMTDIPFTALVLGAIWLGERSLKTQGETPVARRRAWWPALGAGLLAGLSVGFRSLGVAAVGGIGLTLLMKREHRRFLWYSAAASPVTMLWLWSALKALIHPSGPRLAVGPTTSGWTQTLCYFSSYACSWRMNVEGRGALGAVILANLREVVAQPGAYLLTPLLANGGLTSLVLTTLVGVGAYAGVVRYARSAGWTPFPLTYAFYLLVIVPWPYPPDRFLLPFLPLFFSGLWVEGKHLLGLISEHLRPKHPTIERAIGAVFAFGWLALVACVAFNYAFAIPQNVSAQSSRNRQLLRDERGAYEWIQVHTQVGARIIAYRDGLAFLYTARASAPPIEIRTQAFYQNDVRFARGDAARLADVARHIRAGYWLVTPDDFSYDSVAGTELLKARQRQLLATAPVVFRSADGLVRLYDVRCLTGAVRRGCAIALSAGQGSVESPRANLQGRVTH